MMQYELTVTTVEGTFSVSDNLPRIMKSAGRYAEIAPDLEFMQIMNLQTGEVLAAWINDPAYGLTAV